MKVRYKDTGEVVDLSTADALHEVGTRGSAEYLSVQEVGDIAAKEARGESYDNENIAAATVGVSRALSLGLSDQGLARHDPKLAQAAKGLKAENPWVSGLAEAAPYVAAAPLTGAGGLARFAGASAVEGALQEGTQIVSEQALFPNKELSAEKILYRTISSMALSGALGFGFGLPGAALRKGKQALAPAVRAGKEALAARAARKTAHDPAIDGYQPNTFDRIAAGFAGADPKDVARLKAPKFADWAANPQNFKEETVKGKWAGEIADAMRDIGKATDDGLRHYESEVYERAARGTLDIGFDDALATAHNMQRRMGALREEAAKRGVKFSEGKLGKVISDLEERLKPAVKKPGAEGAVPSATPLSAAEQDQFVRDVFGSLWEQKRLIDERLARGAGSESDRLWTEAARKGLRDLDSELAPGRWGGHGDDLWRAHEVVTARRSAQSTLSGRLGKMTGDVFEPDKEKIGTFMADMGDPKKSEALLDLKKYLLARKAEIGTLKELGHADASGMKKVDDLITALDARADTAGAVNRYQRNHRTGFAAERFALYSAGAAIGSIVGAPVLPGLLAIESISHPARAYKVMHMAAGFVKKHEKATKAMVKKVLVAGEKAGTKAVKAAKPVGRMAGAAVVAGVNQARNHDRIEDRIDTLHKLATDPTAFAELNELAEAAPELAEAIQAKAEGVIRELQAAAPDTKRMTMLGPVRKELSHAMKRQFTRILDAMDSGSLGLLEQAAAGQLSPSVVAAVERVYPETVNETRGLIMDAMADMTTQPPYRVRIQLGILFNIPTDRSLRPEFLATLAATRAAWDIQDGVGGGGAKPSREYARGLKDSSDALQTQEDRLSGGIDR